MAAKYLIIARELEHQLGKGLKKLPTEAVLCEQFACSRQTVRSALALLEEKHLIVRRQGSGSYAAQSAANSSREIDVLLPDQNEYLYPGLLRELRRAADVAGLKIRCRETGGDWAQERGHLNAILAQPPAGVVLEPISNILGCPNADLLLRMQANHIPFVYLGSSYSISAPCIRADDAGGGSMLLSRLSQTGHSKVAAILKSDCTQGLERFHGCLRTAVESGVELRRENCLWFSEQERLRLVEGDNALLHRFLSDYLGSCTAVICHNDEIAFRLLRLLKAQQRAISVVSFDNSYLALSGDTFLTSLGLAESPAVSAVHAIVQLAEGRELTEPSPIPWKLHLRKSG